MLAGGLAGLMTYTPQAASDTEAAIAARIRRQAARAIPPDAGPGTAAEGTASEGVAPNQSTPQATDPLSTTGRPVDAPVMLPDDRAENGPGELAETARGPAVESESIPPADTGNDDPLRVAGGSDNSEGRAAPLFPPATAGRPLEPPLVAIQRDRTRQILDTRLTGVESGEVDLREAVYAVIDVTGRRLIGADLLPSTRVSIDRRGVTPGELLRGLLQPHGLSYSVTEAGAIRLHRAGG